MTSLLKEEKQVNGFWLHSHSSTFFFSQICVIGINVSPQQHSWLSETAHLTKFRNVITTIRLAPALVWTMCLLEGFGNILSTYSMCIPRNI